MKNEVNKRAKMFFKYFKNLTLSGIIYFIGYMHWSLAWVIIIVIFDVYNCEQKERRVRKRNFVRESTLGNEQNVILENLEDLPSWVYFPDVERAEWLNRIIKQFWPNVNHYARDFIQNKIENILKSKMEKYSLKGFKFHRVILGSVPFRIGGIIVYDNVSRDEVVLDVDISYAGDCDFKFRLKGLNCGLKNFQLYGKLRLVLRPLIPSIPFVGGVQAFFLNRPEIEFDLDGLAGILEVPGINDLLKKSILDTVSSLMVLPNKFPIRLSERVSGAQIKTPSVAGVLRVNVIEAKDLVKKDIGFTGKGSSDPYTILEVGDQTCRTETIDCTVDPQWNYWCEFIILELNGEQINISVWDQDSTKDEFLGRISLDISNLIKMESKDMWLNLEDIKHGKIHIRCEWHSLSTDYSLLESAIYEAQQLQFFNMNSALLIVFIDSATSLPQVKVSTKPDPYVQIQVGKQIKCSRAIVKTVEPVWEEGFIFFVSNPSSEFLDLQILDAKTDNQLCSLSYNISNLSDKENLEIVEQPFRLENTICESTIVWSLHLKILKNECVGYLEEVAQSRRQSNSSTAGTGKTYLQSEQIEQIDYLTMDNKFESELRRTPSTKSSSVSTRSKRSSKSRTSEDFSFMGKINLSLRYSQQRQTLIVVVHSVTDIPESEKKLYVKLYLLPERHKDSKRKTNVVKHSNIAVFDITFEYFLTQAELNTKVLEVSVIEDKTVKNTVLGKVLIDLGRIDILKTYTNWFDLTSHIKKD